MTKRAIAALFFCLAVVLFLSRYVFAIWFRGAGNMTWHSGEFDSILGEVGIAPWVLAVGLMMLAVAYMVRSEFDR